MNIPLLLPRRLTLHSRVGLVPRPRHDGGRSLPSCALRVGNLLVTTARDEAALPPPLHPKPGNDRAIRKPSERDSDRLRWPVFVLTIRLEGSSVPGIQRRYSYLYLIGLADKGCPAFSFPTFMSSNEPRCRQDPAHLSHLQLERMRGFPGYQISAHPVVSASCRSRPRPARSASLGCTRLPAALPLRHRANPLQDHR